MKVVLISSIDRGGAANACLRLHEGLIINKINSDVLLLKKSKNIQKYHQFSPLVKKQTLLNRLFKKVRLNIENKRILRFKSSKRRDFLSNRNDNLEMFSYPNTEFDITQTQLYKDADIVNLHWVANFLDYSSFFQKNNKPVVWTLHDMNPFTGGEHYSEQITGIDEKGFPKERIVTEIEKKEFQEVLKIKREALKNVNNLHIVSLCSWMTKEVKKSELFSMFPVYEIPNGIDKNIFSPRNVNFSKDLLGIPKEKKIILFVADSVCNHRKGFAFLLYALRRLKSDNYVLLAVGKSNIEIESMGNVVSLGSINDQRLMSSVYSAADVFIIPSLMDNLPNTVIESLLCGTPVIGFPIGGIPDMILHGVNGIMTKEISASSLADSINDFFNKSRIFDRLRIRQMAVDKYALEIQAKAYIELYKKILQ